MHVNCEGINDVREFNYFNTSMYLLSTLELHIALHATNYARILFCSGRNFISLFVDKNSSWKTKSGTYCALCTTTAIMLFSFALYEMEGELMYGAFIFSARASYHPKGYNLRMRIDTSIWDKIPDVGAYFYFTKWYFGCLCTLHAAWYGMK